MNSIFPLSLLSTNTKPLWDFGKLQKVAGHALAYDRIARVETTWSGIPSFDIVCANSSRAMGRVERAHKNVWSTKSLLPLDNAS
jgi:hypothetical protein